jgi:predicted nucleotidyltransferase
MNEHIEKIEQTILKEYEKEKDVLAIFIFGSAARGGFDQYSDVDFMIVLKKKRAYARKNFLCSGIRVDVLFDTEKDLLKYLSEEVGSVRRITSHMIAHGRLLFERSELAKKLQAIAKRNLRGKTKFTKGEILMHLYSIDDFLGEAKRDIAHGDLVAFGLDSNLLVHNAVELLLKLNGGYLHQPREIRAILEKTDPKFISFLTSFFVAVKSSERVTLLEKLADYSSQKAGGPLPKNWKV